MLTIQEITLNATVDWNNLLANSSTATFFQTKEWLQLWTKHFGGSNAKLFGIYEGEELIGIMPLFVDDNHVHLLGTTPVLGIEFVSDFGDIIAIKGREKEVWEAVLKNFQSRIFLPRRQAGNFQFIREDSPSFKILQELGGKAEETDVAPYINLSKTWEEYLSILDRHNRHELRRKMRKLEAEGAEIRHSDGNRNDVDEFFRLMQLGNEQKRDFLSDAMRAFFTDIIELFTPQKILRLWFLHLEDKAIASILTFEYHDEVLLYNSGFDPEYNKLSPGFILKAYAIKDAIEKGRTRFDFLRGSERYKFDFGGKMRKLYKITL